MRYTILCGNDDPVQIPSSTTAATVARRMARRLSETGSTVYVYQWTTATTARPWEAYRAGHHHVVAHATYPAL